MAILEVALHNAGIRKVAGVDEAGRGPCAGPLVLAAVILKDPFSPELARVKDSKALTEKVREELFDLIIDQSLAYSVIAFSAQEIDERGLHKSNLEGMRRAVLALSTEPEYVLTDGYPIGGLPAPNLAVWKGDQVSITISAASIIAKVTRDREMLEWDKKYPEYGFAQHKGYITAQHTRALSEFGICEIHRKSFANIHKLTIS